MWEYNKTIQKMINYDDVTKENIKEHNPDWTQIANHPYRILIIGTSGSQKTTSLFYLKSHQPDIDEIYLYAKDPYEAEYQFSINKRETTGLNRFNDSKAFIKYSIVTSDIYKNNEECNLNKWYDCWYA